MRGVFKVALAALALVAGAGVARACPVGMSEVAGKCVVNTATPNGPPSGRWIVDPKTGIASGYRGIRPDPPTVTPPEPVVAPVANASDTLTPVRAYLRADQIPPAGVGAYGIFALHGMPTSATRDRLMMACASFLSYLPRQSDLPSHITLRNQMLTIWPLDDPGAKEARADKCDFLLDHYALYGADAAMHDAAIQHADFHGDGPFLIGWSPSAARGIPDKLVLVVDMSGFNSQDRFDRALRFWKEKIVTDPQLWRSGWSLDQLRLSVRDFADHYGSDILSAAHLSDANGEKKLDTK